MIKKARSFGERIIKKNKNDEMNKKKAYKSLSKTVNLNIMNETIKRNNLSGINISNNENVQLNFIDIMKGNLSNLRNSVSFKINNI